MNIKGLWERCSLGMIEKPLWGVSEQPLLTCKAEMMRKKEKAGQREKHRGSTRHLFCCPSAIFSRSTILLTGLTFPLCCHRCVPQMGQTPKKSTMVLEFLDYTENNNTKKKLPYM